MKKGRITAKELLELFNTALANKGYAGPKKTINDLATLISDGVYTFDAYTMMEIEFSNQFFEELHSLNFPLKMFFNHAKPEFIQRIVNDVWKTMPEQERLLLTKVFELHKPLKEREKQKLLSVDAGIGKDRIQDVFRKAKNRFAEKIVFAIERYEGEIPLRKNWAINALYSMSIRKAGFSQRVENLLVREGIGTIRQLSQKSEKELLAFKNAGDAVLKEFFIHFKRLFPVLEK